MKHFVSSIQENMHGLLEHMFVDHANLLRSKYPNKTIRNAAVFYQIVWAKAPSAKFAPSQQQRRTRPMTTFINKLIALLPNPREEIYQPRWMAYRGINPLPLWTVNWFYDLLNRVHREV